MRKIGAAIAVQLLVAIAAFAQMADDVDRNTSQLLNYQNECAIIKNPMNKLQLFAACNNALGGLFAARSIDGGDHWIYADADKTIADGDAGQGALACCDPTLAWDTFNNLYITYLDDPADNVVTIISNDGGATFANLTSFGPSGVDQPTVVAANTSDPLAPVAVWIVWNQGNQMRAKGAAVTGTGVGFIGPFGATQTIPGTVGCSFGDVAIAPSGVVVQVCQALTSPTGEETEALRFNIDADGLGAGNFGPASTATMTNVGGFDVIPPQNLRSIDAEAGLAYDNEPGSPHFRRLYLVYTDETMDENDDTDIMVRFSDNDGGMWSAPIRVNDDPPAPIRSQFLPRIASNRLSGNIAVCWHDARNSATNTTMQEFCSIATRLDATPMFMLNEQVSDGVSTRTGSSPPVAGQADIQFGDYSGMTYFQGRVHPIWADNSHSTGDNPDMTTRYDAYTDRVSGGAAAMEGDPHMTTVDGIHYDFQGAGEYVTLRDIGGTEIQARMTAISTTFFPGPNDYTGIASCVSLNTAVAARIGTHRVTFQPNISGVPDPSGMQLRIDGVLTTLGPGGVAVGAGGRVIPSSSGGIEVEFPDRSVLLVTPGWWASQGKWYLNVNVARTGATDGIIGSLAPGSWLPPLPDGSSLGPRPATPHQRWIDLYQKFGNAWRVTSATSLFDYAPGTSTATFTMVDWPLESGPCVVRDGKPAEPLELQIAREACREIRGEERNADCIFDVRVTGEKGFAETYAKTQRVLSGATVTTLKQERPKLGGFQALLARLGLYRESVTLTAAVRRKASGQRGYPTGSVQFTRDGKNVGQPVKVDASGHASTTVQVKRSEKPGASYTPNPGSAFLASSSG
jgi:hypothetical protein